jgi:tRNA threonylcarbamoyladenosine biosynthesis protein TsaB
MLLAIDTATTITGLALYDADGPRAEATWAAGRSHSAQLLPQLDMLLRHVGVGRAAITVLGVALGPGSWSGLRVGLSVAKGMALAGGLPLIGVSTLEAIAAQHARPGLTLAPLIRLGRERFATALFLGDLPARQEDDRNVTLDELCAGLAGKTLFCGDLDAPTVAALRTCLGAKALFPSAAANLRRPAVLAELAWRRHAAGEHDDVSSLEPIYLGEPVKPSGATEEAKSRGAEGQGSR